MAADVAPPPNPPREPNVGGAIGLSKAVGTGDAFLALEPGFGSSQEMHLSASSLLEIMQTGQDHPDVAFFGARPAAPQLNAAGAAAAAAGGVEAPLGLDPGFGSSQETHLSASSLLETIQVRHSQPPDGFFGASPAAPQLNTAGAAAGAAGGAGE